MKTKKRHKFSHRLASFFRFTSRILLLIGSILAAGAVALTVFYISRLLNAPESANDLGVFPDLTFPPVNSPESTPVSPNIVAEIIIATLMVIGVIVGLILTIRQANGFARHTIVKLSKLIGGNIFATEIALSGLIWGLAFVAGSLVFPNKMLAFLISPLFILTELGFIWAWSLYGRPKYSI